ncbi:MFS transporter [Mycobacterium sp. E2479]|uniref:MFS transporter n=1 Tax=Mycobacterium sp. E2479 TaxID=1834134 RepID=UPI0007FDFA73|nr:MFS transporter [Mycobacterium sp. E2479]OBH58701.1 MFS transporter [Mycobacterium sp. E2479]
MPVKPTTLGRTSNESTTSLWSRRFIAAIIAIGGMELMAMMDGSIGVVALPKIQNELGLSNAALSWVITAYILAFGGLMLLGGRLGDTIGRKRTFIIGLALFTIASTVCGIAWDATSLVVARLLQGVAAAIATPTGFALAATTFPKGPPRNAAVAGLAVMSAISAVTSLVVGGLIAQVSWRLVYLINLPIGLVVLCLAVSALTETQKERKKLDVTGAALATLMCTAAVFGVSMAPEAGWLSVPTIGSALVALGAFVAFAVVERTAENPIVPFDLFFDRNRLATFAAIFLAGGVLFTLTVEVALYVQNIMGYDGLHVGVYFIPFAVAAAVGSGLASRLVTRYPPRVLVFAGGIPVLGAMLYGSTLHRGLPFFPHLMVPLIFAAIGIGIVNVPLSLSVIASVGVDRIGPTTAIAMMLQALGGPLVLAFIQVVIMSRTRALGGTNGPVNSMNPAQLHALDQGYTFGMLWLAGVALVFGVVALFIGYSARQVAHAQDVKKAFDAGDLEL